MHSNHRLAGFLFGAPRNPRVGAFFDEWELVPNRERKKLKIEQLGGEASTSLHMKGPMDVIIIYGFWC